MATADMAAEAETIARYMASYLAHPEIQRTQTLFRMQLVDGWQIPRGARVLEIGCGQGDMTAVLANAVGNSGQVMAVDLAAPGYGAPVNLGDSMRYLKATPLGPQIDVHFGYDILAHDFPPDTFDYIVLAHCSWYFASLDQLGRLFRHIRPWAKCLCYSEWDMEPRTIAQVGHLFAVLIQGQIEAYKVESNRNVRTPFSRETLKRLLQETGWNVASEATIDTSLLQDAGWEIADCLHSCAVEAAALALPAKAQALIGSQLDVLRAMAAQGNNQPLPSYSIVAVSSTPQPPPSSE